jgi:hypothetical protein
MFFVCSAKDDPESRLSELSRLITQLPDHNRNSLKVLVKYLREVHDDSSVNKMHASNLVRTKLLFDTHFVVY